jgi:hypothetical protein
MLKPRLDPKANCSKAASLCAEASNCAGMNLERDLSSGRSAWRRHAGPDLER